MNARIAAIKLTRLKESLANLQKVILQLQHVAKMSAVKLCICNNAITCSSFGDNRLRDFSVTTGRFYPFPLTYIVVNCRLIVTVPAPARTLLFNPSSQIND